MNDDDRNPEDEFREFMQQFLNGGTFDPEQLARMGGVSMDPAAMAQVMQRMQQVFRQGGGDGSIDWESTKKQALHIANQGGLSIGAGARADLDQAFTLADLWLSETTAISALTVPPRVITRGEWVEKTLPVWQEIAEPVATSIADALTEAIRSQVPDDMQDIVQGANRLMRGIGGTLFATQLGQVVGKLSLEAVSGADVGIPVMPAGEAVILPQNFADLGQGLEIPDDQLALYVAARELAAARLFRHSKWLRLHVMGQINDFARGVTVDTEALEDLASRFDPSRPEELKQALESGALLPQQTDAQRDALVRLENLVALIEGWVDVVAEDATARVPHLARIAEAIRRRRAEGGPAEDALGALVGLKIRPRRLREASAMWRALTNEVGMAERDALWDYPDLIPTAADIDNPSGLVTRLKSQAAGEAPVADDMDAALAQLFAEEEGKSETADDPDGVHHSDGPAPEDDATDGDDAAGGPRPV